MVHQRKTPGGWSVAVLIVLPLLPLPTGYVLSVGPAARYFYLPDRLEAIVSGEHRVMRTLTLGRLIRHFCNYVQQDAEPMTNAACDHENVPDTVSMVAGIVPAMKKCPRGIKDPTG